MRNPVRNFVGVAVIGVLGALFALPMLGAGAQTNVIGPTARAPRCNITSFSPTPRCRLASSPSASSSKARSTHLGRSRSSARLRPAPLRSCSRYERLPGGYVLDRGTGRADRARSRSVFTCGNENAYTATVLPGRWGRQFTVGRRQHQAGPAAGLPQPSRQPGAGVHRFVRHPVVRADRHRGDRRRCRAGGRRPPSLAPLVGAAANARSRSVAL